MFLITFLLVLLRYGLGKSITGANEIVTILFIYTTAIGAAVAIGKNEHISITVFVDIVPEKYHRMIALVQALFITALQVSLFWYCIEWIGTTGNYLMPATGLPRFVSIISIPAGCLLSILYCLVRLAQIVDKEKIIGQHHRLDTMDDH